MGAYSLRWQGKLRNFYRAHMKTLNQVFIFFKAAVFTTSYHQKEPNDNCVIIENLALEEVGYVFM